MVWRVNRFRNVYRVMRVCPYTTWSFYYFQTSFLPCVLLPIKNSKFDLNQSHDTYDTVSVLVMDPLVAEVHSRRFFTMISKMDIRFVKKKTYNASLKIKFDVSCNFSPPHTILTCTPPKIVLSTWRSRIPKIASPSRA